MKLLLASGSKSRAMLLNQASIPFNRIAHTADEESIAYDKPLAEIIPIIVELKMNHVALPQVEQFGDSILVLCADTMGATADGTIFAKPHDYHDAVRMIRAYRNGATVGTGFILRKYYYSDKQWHCVAQRQSYVESTCIFEVPNELIDWYLEKLDILDGLSYTNVSGAMAIEGVGSQFVKSIQGSYTAIVGLPLFELRQALTELGFVY
jgi:septum formation protein